MNKEEVKDTVIIFRCSKDFKDKFDEACNINNSKMSEIIREFCENYIKATENYNQKQQKGM